MTKGIRLSLGHLPKRLSVAALLGLLREAKRRKDKHPFIVTDPNQCVAGPLRHEWFPLYDSEGRELTPDEKARVLEKEIFEAADEVFVHLDDWALAYHSKCLAVFHWQDAAGELVYPICWKHLRRVYVSYRKALGILRERFKEMEFAITPEALLRWVLDDELTAVDSDYKDAETKNTMVLISALGETPGQSVFDALVPLYFSEEELREFYPDSWWVSYAWIIERWVGNGVIKKEATAILTNSFDESWSIYNPFAPFDQKQSIPHRELMRGAMFPIDIIQDKETEFDIPGNPITLPTPPIEEDEEYGGIFDERAVVLKKWLEIKLSEKRPEFDRLYPKTWGMTKWAVWMALRELSSNDDKLFKHLDKNQGTKDRTVGSFFAECRNNGILLGDFKTDPPPVNDVKS